MDRTRTRRASLRRRPSEAPKTTFEELKPDFQWDQVDDTHHRLLVHFPGFVKREINVEADKSRKLIKITGSSSRRDHTNETTTRIITVDQSYQVPKDGILEEMSMKFQDGYLTIMIPIHREEKKKTSLDHGEKQQQQRSHDHGQSMHVEGGDFPKKPAESTAVEKKDGLIEQVRRKKDELIQEEEMPKSTDDKLDKGPDMEKTPKIAGESKDGVVDPIQKRVESDEREDGGPPLEEIMPKSDDKLHEPEKHKIAAGESNGHDTEDAMIQREKKSEHTDDEEKYGYTQKETSTTKSGEFNVMKRARELMSKGGAEEGPKSTAGSRKRKATWTGLLEKKRSRMIAVAVVAFSLGFYVSHMLRGESNHD